MSELDQPPRRDTDPAGNEGRSGSRYIVTKLFGGVALGLSVSGLVEHAIGRPEMADGIYQTAGGLALGAALAFVAETLQRRD